MRKFVIGILSLLTLLTAIAILVVRRKETQESKCSKTYTQETEMRDVENPFEEIVAQPEGEPVEVVVKLKDYDWREVYKNDILTIIGIGVVIPVWQCGIDLCSGCHDVYHGAVVGISRNFRDRAVM